MNAEPSDTTPTDATQPGRARKWGAIAALFAVVATTCLSAAPAAPVAHADAAATPGACSIYWDGGGGSASWLDAANWSGDRLPYWADDACIYAVNAPSSGITLDGALTA